MTQIRGVYAALLAPRNEYGAIDTDSLRRQFDLPERESMTGYAVNGATGEFTYATPDELALTLKMARAVAPSSRILVGIGAGDVRGAVLRGKIAAYHGAQAVLLPMPSFFPYRQDDLRAFSMAVADAVPIPVLLYNLPQFTSGLEVDTVLSLLRSHDNIVGIKDSGGSLDIVRAMTVEKVSGTRIIGNDSALCPAMEEGVCDGVVSGVACALPELMTELFASKPGSKNYELNKELLKEFIEHLNPLPTPWGLKVASEVRGFTRASYPFPLSAERVSEIASLQTWFADWAKQVVSTKVGKAA
ncbi:dihydrodipicolinate synthase family protein [Terriglobus sp. TAA 43]|uniref:dihydrodipicolinate synthase family protein n=1 Tax=Terriglobus sp. TAA 43 TaxID=278961 RepID=UPI000648D9AE|nr:dihydrodipicolinate synthase family protein [Terriglobus sp. TAA 43]